MLISDIAVSPLLLSIAVINQMGHKIKQMTTRNPPKIGKTPIAEIINSVQI
jgi:hypothetical protein